MMVHDPVCGMEIESQGAFAAREHMGRTYYFCSQSCVDQFDADPHRIMTGSATTGGDRIPIGVFYQNNLESTFQDRISQRIPFYMQNPPAKQQIKDEKDLSAVDLSQFLDDLKTS